MKRKDFKIGSDSLLTNSNDKTKITITEEVRDTFIVNSDHLEKLKAISYWQRKKIKNTVEEAFQHYIDSYEKKRCYTVTKINFYKIIFASMCVIII